MVMDDSVLYFKELAKCTIYLANTYRKNVFPREVQKYLDEMKKLEKVVN